MNPKYKYIYGTSSAAECNPTNSVATLLQNQVRLDCEVNEYYNFTGLTVEEAKCIVENDTCNVFGGVTNYRMTPELEVGTDIYNNATNCLHSIANGNYLFTGTPATSATIPNGQQAILTIISGIVTAINLFSDLPDC